MTRFFDFNHPFFRPLWLRILVTGMCFGWGLVEFITGTPFWGVLFWAVGAVAVHGLFIAFDPDRVGQRKQEENLDV